MEIFLIRHVHTVENEEGRFSGQTDGRLSLKGYGQLDRLSERLKSYAWDEVYCSPLYRARVTAEQLSKSPVSVEEFQEMSFGIFESWNLSEIQKNSPMEYEKMIREADDYIYPQGEGKRSFCERVRSGLQKVLSEADQKKRIVIVAHAGTIRAILSFLLAGDDRLYWNFRIDNASISHLTWQDDFAVIQSLNQIEGEN